MSDAWVETADGVNLRCRIWTPAGRGPWPTLLMRQPYGRAIASTITYAHPHWYASQGFAVVVQDVRGRGDSEGVFSGFGQEAADGSTTLAWLRAQRWCSGRVGSYGFSYQGLSQLLLQDADQLPDALAPAMAGLDERLHWASDGGCHWWALGLGWGLQLAAQTCRRNGDAQGWWDIRRSLESGSFLNEGLSLVQRYDPDGMAARWLRTDPADPSDWTVHEPPAALWQRPMLLVGGWHDPHLNGVLDLWQRCRRGGSEPLLRLGAWSHLHWRGGIDALQLAFFNRHLRGRDDGEALAEQPCWLQEISSGTWLPRPVEQASALHWGLSSSGLAAVDSSEGQLRTSEGGSGSVSVVHDPWRPLPGRGGHLGLDAGCVERGDLDARCDVACFTSACLSQPLELLGRPVLRLPAAADQPGFDLCTALSVLRTDGSVLQCSTGVARFRGKGCLRTEERLVPLQPLLLVLQPGERLRLSIGLAAWPQVAVNAGDGSLPLGPAGPDHRVITATLDLAEAQLSILPMVGAN